MAAGDVPAGRILPAKTGTRLPGSVAQVIDVVRQAKAKLELERVNFGIGFLS